MTSIMKTVDYRVAMEAVRLFDLISTQQRTTSDIVCLQKSEWTDLEASLQILTDIQRGEDGMNYIDPVVITAPGIDKGTDQVSIVGHPRLPEPGEWFYLLARTDPMIRVPDQPLAHRDIARRLARLLVEQLTATQDEAGNHPVCLGAVAVIDDDNPSNLTVA